MHVEKEKSKHKSRRFSLWLHLIWFLPLTAFVALILFFIFFADIVFCGSRIDFSYYPNSELIWSGTAKALGSSECYEHVDIYWTVDNLAFVQDYYEQFPEDMRPNFFDNQTFDINSLSICQYMGFFQSGESESCNIVKSYLLNNGTVIIFSRVVWVG